MICHYLFFISVSFVPCFVGVSSITIEQNAYQGVSISFADSIHESNFEFRKLKDILTRSSELLYHATRRRSYFGEFVVSLPSSWTGDACDDFTNDAPSKIDVHLTDGTDGQTLIAKHSQGCGEEGDIVYMPLHWLKGDTEDLAHQFVKQWSIYRYGVFEEEPIQEGLCFRSKNIWTPAGCYDIQVDVKPTLEDGVPFCPLPDGFFEKNTFKSSLMSQSNSSVILNFCDGSDSFPHNPSIPTLHNNLCEGKTVWSVIESSKDFKYGKNRPLKLDKPPSPPSFKCFKERPIQVTFAIQNNTFKEDLTSVMVELGYSLYQFLRNMLPTETKANVVMFSDIEDQSKTIELDLTNTAELGKTIEFYVRTIKKVTSTCFRCGLEKALKASQAHTHPSPLVVFIAWESSLLGEKPSQLVEAVRSYLPDKVRLHLILVEDTDAEALPSALVDAVRTTGGNIYSLPREPVFMASKLQVLLAGVVKNHLQVEDSIVVVHESIYGNITQSFIDSFSTPSNIAIEKLVYNMYCDPVGRTIQEKNPNCTFEKSSSTTFKCGEVRHFSNQVKSPNVVTSTRWEYPFEYTGGTTPPNCSSMAMLLLSPTSKKPPTLRGWLNNYQISVGQNPLIIYAEINGSPEQKISVFATVTSSALISSKRIQLFDNGNGDPDVKAGDGIYSRYFSAFVKKGTYVVSISAETSNENDTYFSEPGKEKKYSKLVQKKVIGSFTVLDDAPDADIIPPNRIVDLRVTSIENNSVTLQWTAPGNDYDSGKATAYEVYFAEDWKDLQDSMLSKLTPKTLESQDINQPKPSGTLEQANFKLPMDELEVKIYYIVVQGVDSSNNNGKVSNIVQVVIGEDVDVTDENVISNDTETSTDSIGESNEEVMTLAKCYMILGGLAALILLILIINVIIWSVCFKKYKMRWKALQDSISERENSTSVKDLVENIIKDKSAQQSYSNPIMERCSNVGEQDGVRNAEGCSDSSVQYAKVVKKDKSNQGIYQMEQVRNREHMRYNERDLGLV